MNTTLRGRPRKPYVTSWGEHINGLRRRSHDRRWVVVATGEMFSESDERRAIQRFRDIESKLTGDTVSIDRLVLGIEDVAEAAKAALKTRVEVRIPRDPTKPKTVSRIVNAEQVWPWMRDLILSRPAFVAEKLGIPELAHLADLPKPKPSPTLDEVGRLYQVKKQVTPQERRESVLWWQEFSMIMRGRGITTLRQLTAEDVAAWGDEVMTHVQGGKSPVYARHRFGKVKTIVNFARRRGLHPGDCRHALDCLAVLTPPRANGTHPKPIRRDDLHKLLKHADDRTTAAILCGLNLCLAPKEIPALDWNELDLAAGTFVSSRNKTGQTRIGVLWPRTVRALNAIKRTGDVVFTSGRGSRLSVWTLRDDWHKLREVAGVTAELSSLKDGAYTAAIEGGATSDQAALLAGHKLPGVRDAYVRRNPNMVAPACKAIERSYFKI